MPRYDYTCDSCDKTYELQQSFSAESSHVCEECGNGTAMRVLSVPSVVFKGSGFYVNDKGGKDTTASDSELKGPDSSSTKDKPDTKSDTKSKTKSESSSSTKASDAAAS